MADTRGILADTEYSENYYHEHVQAGLDYLICGDWHVSYANMVCDATLQDGYADPAVLDVGCACGAQAEGFRRTSRMAKCFGIDVNKYMVELGREHFGFSSKELLIGSANDIPMPNDSLTLINSGQVLEHIPESVVPGMLNEFMRVLRPGGRMFHNLAALRHGDPLDVHDGDPTHVNIKPTRYWSEIFTEAGFIPDFESYDRFARSARSPGGDYPSFYLTYETWTSLVLLKR